jgi:hypothetical protein
VAISCATPAFCMATDAHGLVVEGTRDWRAGDLV